MMGVIGYHHLGMLIAMWIVLIAIGCTIVVRVLQGLRRSTNIGELAEAVTRPMVFDVLPLIILSLLTLIDPTGILIRIWYYVAAVLIVARQLMLLSGHIKSK